MRHEERTPKPRAERPLPAHLGAQRLADSLADISASELIGDGEAFGIQIDLDTLPAFHLIRAANLTGRPGDFIEFVAPVVSVPAAGFCLCGSSNTYESSPMPPPAE